MAFMSCVSIARSKAKPWPMNWLPIASRTISTRPVADKPSRNLSVFSPRRRASKAFPWRSQKAESCNEDEMILGDILRQFDDPSIVAAALMQFGDIGLMARAETRAAAHGETLGEYASASVRLFSSEAS